MKKSLLNTGIKLLRILPKREAGEIIGRLNGFRLHRLKKRNVPVTLIFFVTNRCNAACTHCFFWKELSREKDELSIVQIEKLLETLQGLQQVLLTGGEPFLREEIVEISTLFHSIGVRSVTIPTNGILTERITDCVSQILRSTSLDKLKINVSLDGTHEVHDSIRNVPGCFDRAFETIIHLKNLRQSHRNLHVSVSCVLSRENITNQEKFIRVAGALQIPVMFSFMRGADSTSFGIAPENRMDFNPRKSEIIYEHADLDMAQEILERGGKTLGSASWNIFQQLKIQYSIDVLRNKKYPLTCLAGHVDGVIHSNGDVSVCELTKPVGNLKDAGMDFQKVWWSEAANNMRKSAKNCCCIHGCNLLSNMQYHEPTLKKILLESEYLS
jgi:MoaA/NifB/PqqE/SkfB family radical SAM enzyme